jgi:Domain of unknown function (DUF4349)
MKPFRDETELAAALRELRPAPRPEFAAELDKRAAAGFPRDSRWGARLARLRERLASTPPRRLIAPAGALAVAAVVVATAVVATTESGDRTAADRQGGNVLSYVKKFDEPRSGSVQAQEASPRSGDAAGGSSGTTYSGEAAAGALVESPPIPPDSGPYAAQAGRREIERSAEIVLGAEPAEVRADAAKVFDAVHAADGIVLSSSIRAGEAGAAGADFELLIPSNELSDALASLSAIGEVRSRQEATQDITAPTVSVGERLQDARATVESLLGQLAGTDTDEERAVVEAQLRSERQRVAALRSRLSELERRANFSRVSLRIETGSSSSSEDGGGWGVGDGIDGAGRILAVAAGVTVIGLAILAPFALIALLAWLCRRAWLRRARREALGRA